MRPRPGPVQSKPPQLPLYRGHGPASRRPRGERDHRRAVPRCVHHRGRLGHGGREHCSERAERALAVHKLLLHHRSADGRVVRQRTAVREADVDHLGRLRVRFHSRVHRRVRPSSHPSLSTSPISNTSPASASPP